jgi:hypothetical protein
MVVISTPRLGNIKEIQLDRLRRNSLLKNQIRNRTHVTVLTPRAYQRGNLPRLHDT